MLSAALAFLLSCPLLMLRLEGGTGSFPKPLPPEKEQFYLKKAAEGDLEARNILIEHNLRLVAHIVKKYYSQTNDQDDLVSIGTIGLIKGISTYRPEKSVKLATYASRCIENEILMYFRRMRKTAGDVSLSDSLDSDPDGNTLSLLDVLSSDSDMLEEINNAETCKQLHEYLEQELSPRELEVLTLRYGLGGISPLTQREIAQRCGISRSYVSRIEKRAIDRIRERFRQDDAIW